MKTLFAGTRITRVIFSILATLASFSLSSTALAAPDADLDGMPDAWETGYGFNPYDAADAAEDTDTDGFSNRDEYRTGTDPLDENSWPAPTTTWFESFEDGVPAGWDTSSDATADSWVTSPDFATDGSFSLRTPGTVGLSTSTVSVTRNFAAGELLVDYYLPEQNLVWPKVLVDGQEVASLYPPSPGLFPGFSLRGTFSFSVPAGIHSVTFTTLRAPFETAHVYLDNVRFTSYADSDNDGLPDFWELQHGLNPDDPADALQDGDGDGLNTFEEYTAGSSITNADTDDDGLLDGDEVVLGSNVLNGDTDFDGLPDGWEIDNGLDPLNIADALGDNDGDGVSNLDEYRLNTNPQDADSVPQKVRRWFESFENGIPADASSDSTADASSDDQWSLINYATHGSQALFSPNFKLYGGWQSRSMSFTKYFEAGSLTASVQVADFGSNSYGEVLLDGFPVVTVIPNLMSWSDISVAIPEGVHTVTFRVSGYPSSSPIGSILLPRILVDNIQYVWDGDSDGDGVPDRTELNYGLNPDDPTDAAADFDGDGLTNAAEIDAGSDMYDADSDDDGLGDADEVDRGTSPINADTDGDGMPDAYEVNTGFDPLSGADGTQDSDGDGVSNYDEFFLGTDPHDATSVPQVTTRWFESFEAGVPADWDASSDDLDATSDAWIVSDEFATDGVLSLTPPTESATDWTYAYQSNRITFTKLFVEGRLSFDANLVDAYLYSGAQVLVDGNVWTFIEAGQQTVSLDLPAGAHSIAIEFSHYWLPDYFPGRPRLFIDNFRFASAGDSDGDGLSDIWEIENGFDPDTADAQLDVDADGLTNADEYLAGTDPNNADSDADGVSDGEEVAAGTGPLQADSDNDGLPDGFELANDLNPLDGGDAAIDSDGDGFSNVEEFRIGTNLRDAASVPQITTSWFESFENGQPQDWDSSTDASTDAANWPWLKSSRYATDGSSSLQSPVLPVGKTTEVYVTRYFAEGTLSFDFTASYGSIYCCNYFVVSVDGVEQVYGYDGWSGRRYLQLTQGVHEIRFSYRHESYGPGSYGESTVWIDNVRFQQGPIELDTDHDGMPDEWEFLNGTSPWDAWDAGDDYDGDGLSNVQEYLAGSSILDEDSDGDGLTDGEEVDVIGSDPTDADSDDDGLPDAWEVSNGLDPVDAGDANADSDGDGFSNYQEFLWGTAANDPGQPALQQTWFESFEAGFPADWDASGDTSSDASTDASSDAPWALSTVKKVPDGIYRLRSGAISYLQNSAVSVSKFLQPGVLFFDYQVSSHLKDTLQLYVNGELKLTDKYSVSSKKAEIALDGGYEQLKFVFKKNTKLSFANNAAFIDNVEFFAHGYDGDLDGIEDIWERRNDLNPYDPSDALKDPDRDRINNLQEYRNGTDPHRFNKPPRAVATLTPGGNGGGTNAGTTGSGAGAANGNGSGTGSSGADNGGAGSDSILPAVSSGGGGSTGLLLLGMAGLAWQRSRKRA